MKVVHVEVQAATPQQLCDAADGAWVEFCSLHGYDPAAREVDELAPLFRVGFYAGAVWADETIRATQLAAAGNLKRLGNCEGTA